MYPPSLFLPPSLSFLLSVPQPGVAITSNTTGPLYAGSALTLTCTVTLDHHVDNSESVVTEWSGPQSIQQYLSHITPAIRESDVSYTSTLTISPLAHYHSGTYTCTAVVIGGTTATASDDISITVIGECVETL